MKVVDAFWELRNLGLKTIEVLIEPHDELDNFDLSKYSADYEVVKVPIELNKWLFHLQQKGYTFAEILNQSKFQGKIPELRPIEKRMITKLACSQMDAEDKINMQLNISAGMFQTDRIALDPYFSISHSANRYIGWIDDEIKMGAVLYNLIFDGVKAGFFILRTKEEGVYASLAGIYNEFKNKGLGLFLNYFEITESRNLGGNILFTAFSSNNLGAEKIHNLLGFNTYKQYLVFIKHNNLNI